MKIKYRPAAIKDLELVCDYLLNKLHNPSAADLLNRKVLNSLPLLRDNPFMGTPEQQIQLYRR